MRKLPLKLVTKTCGPQKAHPNAQATSPSQYS
jgi:hypothetical protein